MEDLIVNPDLLRWPVVGMNVRYREIQAHESLTPQLYHDVFKYKTFFRCSAASADAPAGVIAGLPFAFEIADPYVATIPSLHRSYYSNIETLRACNRARRNSSKNITKTELNDASVQTDCIIRDGVEVMTQTIDKTAVCDVSTQTDCPDFLNVYRGEPDGSSTDSMTHVKTVFGTDQPDRDTTYVKEAYTTSCDFDSVDLLTFSHADSSLGNIDNADKFSSEHNNGTEYTNLLVISDLSFDSDELFGD